MAFIVFVTRAKKAKLATTSPFLPEEIDVAGLFQPLTPQTAKFFAQVLRSVAVIDRLFPGPGAAYSFSHNSDGF